MTDEVEYTTGERRKMAVEWERFFGTDWPEHLNRQDEKDARDAAKFEKLTQEVDAHGDMLENMHARMDESVIYQAETRTKVEQTQAMTQEIAATVHEIHGWVKPKMESEKARGIILRDWKAFVERMKPIIRAIMWLISGATAALIYLKTGHWPDGG